MGKWLLAGAKVELKLAAVSQSSKTGQQEKFCADRQGPVLAENVRTPRNQKADVGGSFTLRPWPWVEKRG